MKVDDLHRLGSVLKTTGTQGELIINFESGLPKDLKKMESIIIDVDGLLVPFFIDEIEEKSSTTAIVKLEDFNDEKASMEFVSNNFYGPELETNTPESYIHQLVGYIVINTNNEDVIGEITNFTNIPNNPLLNIKIGKREEILLPAHEDFIVKIDSKEKKVYYNPPQGLLDI